MIGPAPLQDAHEVDAFECSEPALHDWLKTRAKSSTQGDTARTYVVCDGNAVIGYYALAAGAIEHAGLPGGLRRNAPNPVPVIILARLAVHKNEAGKGLGQDLLKDAMARAAGAADIIGARALLVHAINDKVGAFYRKLGFKPTDADGKTLYITMREIRAAI